MPFSRNKKDEILKIANTQSKRNVLCFRRRRDSRARRTRDTGTVGTVDNSKSSPDHCVSRQCEMKSSHVVQARKQSKRSVHHCSRPPPERVDISGHANVHLGDSYLFNHFYMHETMPISRPWLYTSATLFPALQPYFSRETSSTETCRINQYCVLFQIATNHRVRVMITLFVGLDSNLWQYTKEDLRQATVVTQMPQSLLNAMREILMQDSGIFNDAHIKMSSGNCKPLLTAGNAAWQYTKMPHVAEASQKRLRSLSDDILLHDCPWYLEDQLDHRLIHKGRQSSHFLTYVHPRWVLENRFHADTNRLQQELYTIELLRGTQGQSGFAQFVGLIRDSEGVITGFMCELPLHGKLSGALADAVRTTNLVSKTRRHKWCRQLVQAVAVAHERGFVLGIMGLQKDPCIGIDEHDNIVLYTMFKTSLSVEYSVCIPPEHRPCAGVIQATYKAELYQLGLVLWRVAGHRIGSNRTELCKEAQCTETTPSICKEPHTDPISLPMSGTNYPCYLQNVINNCRQENPEQRSSAREMMSWFPQNVTGSDTELVPVTLSSSAPDPVIYQTLYAADCSCDYCAKDCTSYHFHCSICYTSNFDICPHCFLQRGLHCLDIEHFMSEYNRDYPTNRCYSGVQPGGKRKELDLKVTKLARVA